MATLVKGSWWRVSYAGLSTTQLRACVIAPTRTVFVGVDGSAPWIQTVNTADLGDLAPTHTVRTAAGTDQFFGVDHIATEDIVAAVGNNGRIEESTDQGLNWTGINVTGNPLLYDVVGVTGDAASRFIAVGVNKIWGQDNVPAWTERWTGSQQWFGVAHRVGAGWVAVGNGGFASHSPTGAAASWTAPYSVHTVSLNKVRANASYFLAISSDGKIFRSTTGLSASWTDISFDGPGNLLAIAPMALDNSWAILDSVGNGWTTADNGDNWTANPVATVYPPQGIANTGTNAVGCGTFGAAFVSFEQTQEDYVAPDIELQAPPLAFAENDDMAGDAVRRLVTQLRSGRG